MSEKCTICGKPGARPLEWMAAGNVIGYACSPFDRNGSECAGALIAEKVYKRKGGKDE